LGEWWVIDLSDENQGGVNDFFDGKKGGIIRKTMTPISAGGGTDKN